MEKELFVSTLKEKSQVDNLSDRTIDEVATLFLPQFADDDKITDDSWVFPVQMVKTMSGQIRHDLSGGINDFKTKYESEQKAQMEKDKQAAIDAFKAEWEKNHPTNEPPKKESPKTEPTLEEKLAEFEKNLLAKVTGEESAFGKLSKQFSDYMNVVAEEKKSQAVSNIRGQVREYLLGRGVEEDDYALEICLEKLEIGDNPDISALKTKAEKDYESIFKRMHKNDGAQPFKGGGGGAGGVSPLIKSHIDRVAKDAKDAEDYAGSIEFAK